MKQILCEKEKAAKLLSVQSNKLSEAINVISVEDNDYIDLVETNKAVLSRSIKYDVFKVHTKQELEFSTKRTINNNGMNVIDLFCGAGGSSSGFRLAGFNLVGALDVNKAAAKTHELNFRDCKTIVGDITAIKPSEFHRMIGSPRVDIVIGSPPCQTFSSLSQGKIKSLGKDIKLDIRNYFYKYYLDYISFFKPKFFLMENVPGFKTKYGGAIFQDFLTYVSKNLPEYSVKYDILDAQNYSVPQTRKRLFVCGYLKKYEFDFPAHNDEFCTFGRDHVSVREAIMDLPIISDNWRIDLGYYSSPTSNKFQDFMRVGDDVVPNNICRISNPQAKEMFELLKPKQRFSDLTEKEKKKISLFDSFDSSVIQSRCRRLPLDEPSWTVIAHIGMDGYEYIHPTECRTLSVREAARLQSFPDDFVFVGNMREQYVQVGNAVPSLLSYAVAKAISKSLNDN